jgi:hypothetical protein
MQRQMMKTGMIVIKFLWGKQTSTNPLLKTTREIRIPVLLYISGMGRQIASPMGTRLQERK